MSPVIIIQRVPKGPIVGIYGLMKLIQDGWMDGLIDGWQGEEVYGGKENK